MIKPRTRPPMVLDSEMDGEGFPVTMATHSELVVPDDMARCIRDGVLVGIGTGYAKHPMEADGYTLYLALKALEARTGIDYRAERETIANAALKRLRDCGGFWYHGLWTGSIHEVHLRFTSSAI